MRSKVREDKNRVSGTSCTGPIGLAVRASRWGSSLPPAGNPERVWEHLCSPGPRATDALLSVPTALLGCMGGCFHKGAAMEQAQNPWSDGCTKEFSRLQKEPLPHLPPSISPSLSVAPLGHRTEESVICSTPYIHPQGVILR